MDDTTDYKIIITKKGQQIPVSASAGLSLKVFPAGDSVKREVPLDVSRDEFEHLQDMAKTNSISDDILKTRKALET